MQWGTTHEALFINAHFVKTLVDKTLAEWLSTAKSAKVFSPNILRYTVCVVVAT